MGRILVVGSINMDIVSRVQRHPHPGETIKGEGTTYHPGGKGANQAVAAALAGGQVTMIGAVGDDAFANVLIAELAAKGVQTDTVLRKTGSSGIAFITVDASGENSIILSEGSNGKLSVQDVRSLTHLMTNADAVILQNEIPWKTTRYVIETAHRVGCRVYFNPAPALQLPTAILPFIDVIILNETEAEEISDMAVKDVDHAVKVANQLISDGIGTVICTFGAKGALAVTSTGEREKMPAFSVQTIDTTAAGDTFIGVLVMAMEEGRSLTDSLRFASAAAAIAVTKKGAQESIPDRKEINAFLDHVT